MAAELSKRHGWIDEDIVTRTKALLEAAALPTTLYNPHVTPSAEYDKLRKALSKSSFINLMSMDKKVANGQLSLVLLEGCLGKCVITNKFNTDLLDEVVSEYTS